MVKVRDMNVNSLDLGSMKKLIDKTENLQKNLPEIRTALNKMLNCLDEIEYLLNPPLESVIEELGLSCRAINCLKRLGVRRVGELINLMEDDLRAVKNLGQKSIVEIKEKLHCVGLTLRGQQMS